MSRLGALVVGALAAPLSGTMAAYIPGEYAPPPIERVQPGFLDLNGWYVRADAGSAWGGAEAASGPATVADDSLGSGPVAAFGATVDTRWLGTDVTPRLTLDAGYRDLNFTDVATGGDAAGQMTSKNIAAHEVRVSMRWTFNDAILAK